MKYIIEVWVGAFTYWIAKKYINAEQQYEYYITGLRNNAFRFNYEEEAEQHLGYVKEQFHLPLNIIRVKK